MNTNMTVNRNTVMNTPNYAVPGDGRYYQIRIYENDPVKLLRRCDLCSGEVYLQLEDDVLSSLKSDKFMRLVLRSMEMPAGGVKLLLTNAEDLSLFLEYLSGVWTAVRS